MSVQGLKYSKNVVKFLFIFGLEVNKIARMKEEITDIG